MKSDSEPTFQESSSDAYSPAEMAKRVLHVGVKKAELDFWSTLILAVLAGAFISLGAIFATVVSTDSGLGFGVSRLLSGLVFSLGLILVVVAGAELFTGNNLIVMAWASRKVTTLQLLRNWGVVYLGNAIGALTTAFMIYASGHYALNDYSIAITAINIANAKVNLSFWGALFLGIFCNALVCLAVWLCFSARTTTDKILSILFPITAFVAAGFEHSIANMYFIPIAILIQGDPAALSATGLMPQDLSNLNVVGLMGNLIPVTLGNMIGGGILVSAVYWFIYLRRGE